MKKIITLVIATLAFTSVAQASSSVAEGVVKKAEVITTQVGKDGKPLLGAAVGVAVGSAFGSGSGKDAAQIAGGLIGAKRQASKSKKTLYGWRYIVEIKEELNVVDAWCETPEMQCKGVKEGTEVYVINGKEVIAK